jgi:hypothetical protein
MAHQQERQFGLLFAVVFLIVAFWPLWPVWPRPMPGVVWLGAAAASALLGLLTPRLLTPLYTAWMALGHVLGWINARIILGLVFFVVVTPTALLMRLTGKNLLGLKRHTAASYWVERDKGWTPESMRNQF